MTKRRLGGLALAAFCCVFVVQAPGQRVSPSILQDLLAYPDLVVQQVTYTRTVVPPLGSEAPLETRTFTVIIRNIGDGDARSATSTALGLYQNGQTGGFYRADTPPIAAGATATVTITMAGGGLPLLDAGTVIVIADAPYAGVVLGQLAEGRGAYPDFAHGQYTLEDLYLATLIPGELNNGFVFFFPAVGNGPYIYANPLCSP